MEQRFLCCVILMTDHLCCVALAWSRKDRGGIVYLEYYSLKSRTVMAKQLPV